MADPLDPRHEWMMESQNGRASRLSARRGVRPSRLSRLSQRSALAFVALLLALRWAEAKRHRSFVISSSRAPVRFSGLRPRPLPVGENVRRVGEAEIRSKRSTLTALPSPSHVLGVLGPFGFFVAGGLCSSLSHVIATPIDVVKTSQQAEEERYGKSPGMFAMGMKLIQSHGPRRLLSGAGATFTGYFFHGAFKYGLFEVWKTVFQIHKVSLALHIPVLCLCAFLAELLATVVLCPAEAARIMLVADPEFVMPARLAWERFCQRSTRAPMHGIHTCLSLAFDGSFFFFK